MPDPAVHSPRDLYVVSVADPAIDRNPPVSPTQVANVNRYAERRTVDALAAVAFHTNDPAVFRVRALSARARASVLAEGGVPGPGDRYSPRQMLAAVRAGVVSVIRQATLTDGVPSGAEEALPVVPETVFPILTDAAVDQLCQDYGGAVLDELGAVVLGRSEMHPRRATDFSLPRSARDQI